MKEFKKPARVLGAALALATVFGASTRADAVVFNFSGPSNNSGDTLAASVEFLVSGTTLTVILTNTAAGAATDGADVLDGVYFDIAGSPTVVDGSAALTAGSVFQIRDGGSASGNPLNNEWMFDAPSLDGRGYGLGSTGFPGFNPNQDALAEFFDGADVQAGANSDYGIIPTAGITAGNQTNVYVNNSVTFTLELNSAISESDIGNVAVSYGSDGSTILVPEPATMGVLGLGALALVRRRLRK